MARTAEYMTSVSAARRELRANEMRQHLVQVAEHALQEFALRPRLDQIQQRSR